MRVIEPVSQHPGGVLSQLQVLDATQFIKTIIVLLLPVVGRLFEAFLGSARRLGIDQLPESTGRTQGAAGGSERGFDRSQRYGGVGWKHSLGSSPRGCESVPGASEILQTRLQMESITV